MKRSYKLFIAFVGFMLLLATFALGATVYEVLYSANYTKKLDAMYIDNEDDKESRFDVIYNRNGYTVVVDRETDVEYLVVNGSGVTVMRDSGGMVLRRE